MRVEYQVSEQDSAARSGIGLFQYPIVSSNSNLHATPYRQAARLNSIAYVAGKRSLDILLVLLSTPLLLPLLVLLSIAVALTSPGPIFFSHRRICRDGRFFSMWKFRTMCVNSAEVLDRYLAEHPAARTEWMSSHKLRHDPRVTPLGRFMRKFSLDELPQIWNVLGGEMSLVGPRPIVAAEAEKYGDRFSCYTSVKPGLTGLWQVSGRSTTTYDQRVALDCDYVHNWSLAMDAKILCRTFQSVVTTDGAF